MLKLKYNSLALGKAGEHRVIAELLAREIVPCVPVIDIACDLVTSEGVRLQVKSTRLVTKPRYSQPVYWFNLAWHKTKGRRRRDGTKEYSSGPRSFAKECDFVILWGCDQDRFWVVPSRLLDRRSVVVVGGQPRWIETDVAQLRSARDEGLTYEQIARKFHLDDATVFSRLNGHSSPKQDHGKLAKEVNACENRWDLIEQFARTVTGPSVDFEKLEMVNKEIGGAMP
jgi:hypothetical protein